MSVVGFQEYKIGGVSILFPCKPYPSQFSMMDKIIKGIERRQNCLLESPTGSGKSLALLCSTLAWQQAEKEKFLKEEEHEQMVESCCCSCHTGITTQPINHKVNITEPGCDNSTKVNASPYFMNGQDTDKPPGTIVIDGDDDDDDDFKPDGKKLKALVSKFSRSNPRKHVSISYDNGPLDTGQPPLKPVNLEIDITECKTEKYVSPEECQNCSCKAGSKSEKTTKRKIPKIYFGTRTHKQVAQIVRELRKTAYSDVRMTILASREHTCIHPVVSKSSNKNEGCQDLLNGSGCILSEKAKRVSSHLALNAFGLVGAWDLEDIVNVMKKKKACPYFVTKGLKDCSDLIICPYNYLVDPVIRKSMEISLKHNIIILDEGHNIEDSAREAGSQTIMDDSLSKVSTELDALIEANIKVADHLKIKKMCANLEMFIHQESENLEQKDFDKACKIWSGFDIVAQMNNMNMGPKHFHDLQRAFNSICEEDEDQFKNARGEVVKIGSASRQVLEQIFMVLDYMYRHDLKFVEDYRVAVLKTTSYSKKPTQPTNAVWLMSKRNRRDTQPSIAVSFSLNFWCMNPAVAFSDFAVCRCLVLTSGTLSPTSSFQSELGLPFPIQLEANHVIKDNQIWVGAIGQGPKGSQLQAVYRNVETFAFQDELGELILRVCETVPHGVLCFLSSYKMLEKVQERWKVTGLWNKILKKKKIISEPRASDKLDFEELMKYFYKVVETGEDSDDSDSEGDTDGALFLAVCRGKVSEGLDFADNFARAVITVGIPYPNFKDIQVELKRKYNDQNRSRGLLSGSDWYEIQAFRALNQALGRCIRHRKDWGALILVDDRFVKNSQKYCKGLSKWVRNKMQTFPNFNQAMESLASFTKNRIEASEKEGPDTSFFLSTPSTPSSQPTTDQEPATSPRTPFQNKLNTSDLFSPPNSENVHKSAAVIAPQSGFVTPTRGLPAGTCFVSSASTVTPDLMTSRQNLVSQLQVQSVYQAPGQISKTQIQKVNTTGQTFLIPQAGFVPGQQEGSPSHEVSEKKSKTKKSIDENPDKSEQKGVSASNQAHDGAVVVVDQPLNPKPNLNSKNSKGAVSIGTKFAQGIDKFFKPSKTEKTALIHDNNVISEKPNIDSSKDNDCCGNNASDSKVNNDANIQLKSSQTERNDAAEKLSESPLLFEGSSQSEPSLDVPQNKELAEKNLRTEQTADQKDTAESCKKPLFRRKSCVLETKAHNDASDTNIKAKLCSAEVKMEANILVKSEETTDKLANMKPCGEVDKMEADFQDTSEEIMANSEKPKSCDIKVKMEADMNILDENNYQSDKTKSCDRKVKMEEENTDDYETMKSGDRQVKEESDVLVKLEVKRDGHSRVVCSDQEDFEEPVIKRRSARQMKRKSDGMFKLKNKKHKGIDFVNDSEEQRSTQIQCCACDSVLVQDVKDLEQQKSIPAFLQKAVEKKNVCVIHFITTELPPNLQVLTSDLQSDLPVNCLWKEDHKACIQYLKCTVCKPGSLDGETVGCRVVFSSDTSEFKTGETWLLSSMVKWR